jgi:hypothetical protein
MWAVTETGGTIYVYANGTWSFEMQDEAPEVSEFGFWTYPCSLIRWRQSSAFLLMQKKK